MNLDKRIKKGKIYLDCFDIEKAKKFIGEECYIAEEISDFTNVSTLTQATLKDIIDYDNDKTPFILRDENTTYAAHLIIPCDWVEELRYRPYTLTEFLKEYHLGDEIVVRRNDCTRVSSHKLFVEYRSDIEDKVLLGGFWYSFQDLCEDFKVRTNDGWKPFGIKR